jgi:hypothetical protein
LPEGSLNIFAPRKAGKYAGLSNDCPFCDEKPPEYVYPHQRRRWQSCHIATMHVKQ